MNERSSSKPREVEEEEEEEEEGKEEGKRRSRFRDDRERSWVLNLSSISCLILHIPILFRYLSVHLSKIDASRRIRDAR